MRRKELYALFEEKHLRLTQARRGFVHIFAEAELPLTALQILQSLQSECKGVNKTTVYRELERWEALGLIEKLWLTGDEYSYELKRDHHHHLICIKCSHIENVSFGEDILKNEEKRAMKDKKFLILKHSLEFFGLCKHCNTSV